MPSVLLQHNIMQQFRILSVLLKKKVCHVSVTHLLFNMYWFNEEYGRGCTKIGTPSSY